MSDEPVKLYQKAALSLGAGDLIYVSRPDGSSDGSATFNAAALLIHGINGGYYDAAGAAVTAVAALAATLAPVATSGAYADLTGTPALALVATSGAYADLSGRPTLGALAALDTITASYVTDFSTAADARIAAAVGVSVQAYDADLSALAALTGTNTLYYRSGANTWSPVTIGAGLSFSAGTLDTAASVTSFNTRTGAVTLTSGDVTTALGFTPLDAAATSFGGSAAKLTTARAITMTGDVSWTVNFDGSAAVSAAGTIQANAVTTGKIADANVTLAKIANIADQTILGNNAGVAGPPIALTAAQVRTVLALVVGTNVQAYSANLAALAALSTTNTIYYLSAANTWSAVTIGSGLSFSGGSLSATGFAGSGAVTGSGLTMSTNRLLGRTTASTGAIEEISTGTGLVLSAGSLAVDTGTSGAKVPLLNGANTYSGFLTFSAGADITPAAAPSTVAVGYLGAPVNQQDTNYTLVMGDAGKLIYHTSASTHAWTIPANGSVAFPVGTVIAFINENGGGNVTIAITTDTLRWGSSTGSRTLAANGTASAVKVTSTTWRLTGDGIT